MPLAPLPHTSPPASAAVLPVSLFVSSARLLVERHLAVAWVGGEISNLYRAASGHVYFVLKDAGAQVRCVLWRTKAQLLDVALKDGLAVEVRAGATIYEAKGEFQLNVDTVRLAGVGALYERFARLKARLEIEGLFAAERKRPLPAHPRAVGVVTSPRGAALRDVLTTLARRAPSLRVVIYPCAVQGDGAAGEIAQAIRTANVRRDVDVLIVCRGGGSIEDLWAFNEEIVARAIHGSALPVVSGVGHETDFTIADFVADLRAPTPTGAATMIAPDRLALLQRVAQSRARLARAVAHALATRVQRLDHAAARLVHPAARLAAQRTRLSELAFRLANAWDRRASFADARMQSARTRLCRELRAPRPEAARLERAAERWQRAGVRAVELRDRRLASLAQNLAHLDPRGVLTRGYAIVTTVDGSVVQDSAQLAAGDAVTLAFARGEADALVRTRR